MKKIVFLIINSLLFSEILNPLKYRAVENKLYNTIEKINIIQYYINDFILNNAKVPNIVDIGNEYTAINTGVTWWPKNYKNISNITFSIDANNTFIRYSNIFSSIPSDINIVGIFTKNIALKQDSMIHPLTLDIIMPLKLKTIEFLQKISNMPLNTTAYIENHSKSYMTCNASRDNDTLYEANGSGDFDIYVCDNGNGWIVQPIFTINSYVSSSVITESGIDVNRTIYTDINTTTLSKRILIGNAINNVANAKRIKR